MEQYISRRMILSLVPIQINNKMKKARVAQPTNYVSNSDEGKLTVQKNSSITLNFDSAEKSFQNTIIIENNNDQLITKKEIIQWYDPFTNNIKVEREAIAYILDGEKA